MSELRIEDLTHAFVEHGNLRSVIDFVNPRTQKSLYAGETIEEVRKRYPTAEIILFEDWQKQKAAEQDRPVEWSEVTEEQYDEALGCLPPVYQGNGGFLVGEPASHHAVSGAPLFQAYRVRDGKYFASSRAMSVKEFKTYA